MGYFPNGTAGMLYREQYCSRCIHDRNQDCPIWAAHLIHNYKGSDDAKDILNMLIPRSDCENEQCALFLDAGKVHTHKGDVMPAMKEWAEKHGVLSETPKQSKLIRVT